MVHFLYRKDMMVKSLKTMAYQEHLKSCGHLVGRKEDSRQLQLCGRRSDEDCGHTHSISTDAQVGPWKENWQQKHLVMIWHLLDDHSGLLVVFVSSVSVRKKSPLQVLEENYLVDSGYSSFELQNGCPEGVTQWATLRSPFQMLACDTFHHCKEPTASDMTHSWVRVCKLQAGLPLSPFLCLPIGSRNL